MKKLIVLLCALTAVSGFVVLSAFASNSEDCPRKADEGCVMTECPRQTETRGCGMQRNCCGNCR